MALTPFSGTKPQRNNRTTFSTLMDAWITWFLDTFMEEIDDVVNAMNLNSTNATSATSDTIATGSTTITVQTGKSYLPGMTIKCANTADGTKWMLGEVTAYDSGTGSLTFYSRLINGSGTYSAWTITLAATPQDVGDHCVWVHTGNGFGSTKTKHRRYGATKTNVGTAITYADSSTDGATFTVNENGNYEMIMCDRNATASRDVYFGIAVNSASGTTNIQGDAAQLIYSYRKDNDITPLTITHKLAAGDVVTAKGGTGATYMPDATGQQDSFFIIRKVSNG